MFKLLSVKTKNSFFLFFYLFIWESEGFGVGEKRVKEREAKVEVKLGHSTQSEPQWRKLLVSCLGNGKYELKQCELIQI
jgi:hypothetical protein